MLASFFNNGSPTGETPKKLDGTILLSSEATQESQLAGWHGKSLQVALPP